MFKRFVLLLIGTIACSTAAIIIKLSETHPILLAGYRCLIAAVILSPLYFRDLKVHGGKYQLRHFWATAGPGVFLGLHFITWIFGVRETTEINATLLVMMVPITMPFFVWVLFRQKLNGAEWLGTALSVAGVLILTAADLKLSQGNFRGDLLSLGSLLLLTYYLILARVNSGIASLWLYIVPLYFIAGAFCLLCSVFFVNPIQAYSMREIGLFLALAIIPTVLGHSIFNFSMQQLPSQLVAIVGSSQFIFTGIIAYFILKNEPRYEPPKWSFYIASALVVGGIIVAIRARNGRGADKEN